MTNYKGEERRDHTGNCKRITELETRHNKLEKTVASWDGVTKLYQGVIAVLQVIILVALWWVMTNISEIKTDIAVMQVKQASVISAIKSAKKTTMYNQDLIRGLK